MFFFFPLWCLLFSSRIVVVPLKLIMIPRVMYYKLDNHLVLPRCSYHLRFLKATVSIGIIPTSRVMLLLVFLPVDHDLGMTLSGWRLSGHIKQIKKKRK